jgi:hypothetical protein
MNEMRLVILFKNQHGFPRGFNYFDFEHAAPVYKDFYVYPKFDYSNGEPTYLVPEKMLMLENAQLFIETKESGFVEDVHGYKKATIVAQASGAPCKAVLFDPKQTGEALFHEKRIITIEVADQMILTATVTMHSIFMCGDTAWIHSKKLMSGMIGVKLQCTKCGKTYPYDSHPRQCCTWFPYRYSISLPDKKMFRFKNAVLAAYQKILNYGNNPNVCYYKYKPETTAKTYGFGPH